jgi:hypothetical protein
MENRPDLSFPQGCTPTGQGGEFCAAGYGNRVLLMGRNLITSECEEIITVLLHTEL